MSDATAAMNDATSGERVRNQQRHRLREQRQRRNRQPTRADEPQSGEVQKTSGFVRNMKPRALEVARGSARALSHHAGADRAPRGESKVRSTPIAPRHERRHSAQKGMRAEGGCKRRRHRHLARPVVWQHIRWCATRIRA
jgi:hypothetical protein